MANKTALPHSRLLSVQRRPAPTAWAALPSAVASQGCAVKPPRSVQALPYPTAAQQQQLPGEAGCGAGLLSAEPSSTAVTAAAALQAQRSLLAAAAALAEPPSSQQQQVQGAANTTGYQPQQQWWLQYTPRGQGSTAVNGAAATAPAAAAAAGDAPALCASVSPISKGSSSRASSRQRGPAVAGSLECSSVVTGSVVVAALPAGDSNDIAAVIPGPDAAAVASNSTQHREVLAVPPVPYNLRSPSEMLPSPRRLLQQADRQQLTASLVRQLSHTNSSSCRAGAGGAGQQDALHGRTTSQEYDPVQAHTNYTRQLSPRLPAAAAAEYRGSSAYGRTAAVQEQSLRQRCSATAVSAAAAAEQAGVPVPTRRLGLTHSQLTVDLSRVSMMSGSSMACSMAGDRPNSSRPGSRASDVCSIVSKAKERSAARQRLPGGTATPRHSSSSGMALLSPRGVVQQQQLRAATSAADGVNSVTSSKGGEGVTDVAGAAAEAVYGVAGGEQAMRMLQDYRTMAELDAAIKARVSQLSSSTADKPDAARAANFARAGGSNTVRAAGGRVSGSAVGSDISSKAARASKAAAAGNLGRVAATPSPEADTANRSDCSPVRQQQQQRAGRPGPAESAALADGAVAVGLLGIWEALDNSYDAGKPAAAAAGGYSSSWGSRGTARQVARAASKQAQADAGYRNPFLSPSPTESPTPDVAGGGAAAGRDAGRGYLQQQR
jgi:hypothetical protein